MFVCLLFNSAIAIEEQDDEIYYLVDCINLAIENSPYIKKAKYNLEIADKNLNIYKSSYFPTLGAGVHYNQYINSDKRYDDGYRKAILPDVGVYLQQLIYDFGKTSAAIDMGKFNKIAAQYEYENTVNETVNAVKLAYFSALEASSAVGVEQDNVEISSKIVDFTREQFEKNQKSQADYQDAIVHLIDAKMRLQHAQNLHDIALSDLQNTMYIDEIKDIKIKRINEFFYRDAYFQPDFIKEKNGELVYKKPYYTEHNIDVKYDAIIRPLPFSFEEAYESANKKNPKLKALENTMFAMEKQLSVTKRDYLPVLSAKAGYNHDDKYVSDIDNIHNNQLRIDVTLDSSVNVMKKKNEIERAKQIVNIAKNDIEMFKKDIYYEIKKCYSDSITAQKQIINAKDKVENSKKTLEIVNKQYRKNLNTADYLELQAARSNFNNAKLEYIAQLRYYNSSLAKLERASLITIEHENQSKN